MTETNTSEDDAAAAFVAQLHSINSRVDSPLIEKAYRFSWHAHLNQVRKSGEPFLAHPVAVALILAEQKLDIATIAAGLLHDVLEDTPVTREQIALEFGETIALLVDGVTKIRKFQMRSHEERQAETYRKMLLSMAQDIRVIIIKFADRLHNLRTLHYLDPTRIHAIAAETLDIYAPLAHRLGMARIKWELEDLAFKYMYPKDYAEIVGKVVANRNDREAFVESVVAPLRMRLSEEHLNVATVGRPKHFYSIYRKMVQRNKPFEEIYDLLAIRIITDTVKDCYHVLGVVHSLWRPIQERFKDYISMPKSNGYQSLHTTVFTESGTTVEIQIRTWEMNHVAEDGIAAHWLYKENGGSAKPGEDDKRLVWLKNLIEWQKDLTDSAEFYEFFKIDLFQAEIFVFTPKGDLISMPKGATALDFAFMVHTELGLHCVGARIDGKIEPISNVLRSGSTIEILRSSSKKPSVQWLREVKTVKARSAIRRWLKNAGHHESVELGKKIVATSFKKLRGTPSFDDHVPQLLLFLGINSLDRLYESVGSGELPAGRVMQYFESRMNKAPRHVRMLTRLVRTFAPQRTQRVIVGGADNLMVRFARCCNPIPGDPIIGFVTRGRGISIHRYDCPHVTLFSKDSERRIAVSWDDQKTKKYIVMIEIVGLDRPGMLHEISSVFANFGVNVLEGTIKTKEREARIMFKVEIQNRNQLKQILRRIQRIKGIENISRIREDREFLNGAAEAAPETGRGPDDERLLIED